MFVSHLHLCLSSLSLHRWTQKPTPRRNSHLAPYHTNPKTEIATRNLAPQSTTNPAPYHAIEHGETNTPTPYHEFAIHGSQPSSMAKPTESQPSSTVKPISRIRYPRPITKAMQVRARHGANEVLSFIEAELWNLGFFVCGFCWLMRFWLIYLVLGVWVDGLLLDYFTTMPEMKAPAEVTDGRELKMRERREMWEKI